MARSSVGVDIGTTAVRVVETKGIDPAGYAIISRIGIAPLREGAILRGVIRSPLAVSQSLIRALKQAGVPPYGFVVGHSAPDSVVTQMTTPAVLSSSERVRALHTMGTELSSSLKLADAVLSTNEIRRFDGPDGTELAAIVVGAVSRTDLEHLRNALKLAKVQPAAVDLTGVANLRALMRVPESASDIGTAVDIGATKTTVATRQGHHVRSLRQLSIGGHTLTRVIQQVTGESWEDAESRQRLIIVGGSRQSVGTTKVVSGYGSGTGIAPGVEKETLLEESVRIVADDLVEQIASAIDYDASRHRDQYTQGVILTGRGAQIRGLRERLSERLGLDVRMGRPWARIERSRRNMLYLRDGKDDPRLMVELTTAIGLSLWKERS